MLFSAAGDFLAQLQLLHCAYDTHHADQLHHCCACIECSMHPDNRLPQLSAWRQVVCHFLFSSSSSGWGQQDLRLSSCFCEALTAYLHAVKKMGKCARDTSKGSCMLIHGCLWQLEMRLTCHIAAQVEKAWGSNKAEHHLSV